jgi:GAF domain-containing protein
MEGPSARLTAMAEVLQIMSRTSFELRAVLEAVVERASRLCRAQAGFIYRLDGDWYRLDVALNITEEFRAFTERSPIRVDNLGTLTARVGRERRTIQIPDVLLDPEYTYWEAQRLGKFRALLGVPLIRDDAVVGVITLWRMQPEPFTDEEAQLVSIFADQVVIAIEQARRARELADSLEQQTAASEVLRIIGQSTADLTPVFEALIKSAVQLCAADHGGIIRFDPQTHEYIETADFGVGSDEYRKVVRRHYRPSRETLVGRTIMEAAPVRIDDVLLDSEYKVVEAQQLGGFRSIVGVPLLREGFPIGVIAVWRREVRPFTDREIRILSTFANQAVIAIENARHAAELADTLEQQTASSEVLRIISRSTADVGPVFEALIKSAVLLCAGDHGGIVRFDPMTHRHIWTADYGVGSEEYRQSVRQPIYHPSRETLVGRTIMERVAVRIDDVLADPEYKFAEAQQKGGFRSIVGVPLLRDGFPIGVIVVWRRSVTPFTDREVRILTTFAEQAVVAVENARLVRALQRQTEELSRFVTPQVASMLSSEEGEQLLAGHRRLIAAMFCDLRAFTAFSETAEPEEVFGVLREYQAAMGQLIAEHGGTLEHLAGDGIMLFFNDPVPSPGFETQAVRCAVAMRDRFGEVAQGWRRRGYELDLGIGAALGYATLGRVGYEGHYQYNAIGNVVILASRLSAEARGGEILITQRLYAAVEELVTVGPVRETTLKGFSRPVPVYNVVALRAPGLG